MKTHFAEGDYQVIIVDSRQMYREGIKSVMHSIISGCSFSEYGSLADLPMESTIDRYTYFFFRAGNMSDKAVIGAIKKIRSVYLNCKIILFDYQNQIQKIIHFFREKIDAYLPDDFGSQDLKDCLEWIASNRIYINMQIAIDLMITTPRAYQRKKTTLPSTEIKVANLLVSS